MLEREAQAGGIPRHSDHTGYGLRDLRRLMTGPAYARHLRPGRSDAGAVVQTRSMVTGWADASHARGDVARGDVTRSGRGGRARHRRP